MPLPDLLARLAAAFPAAHPLRLRPPAAEAADQLAARGFSGHAARWFTACDGQEGAEPAVDAHVLCDLDEALATADITDALRAEPDGYWVEPHWLAIASDGAGQHLLIDDRDGRVLAVAHDDDAVAVLAPTVEAWLEGLLADVASGRVVWDATFGLVEADVLADIAARREARAAPPEPRARVPFAVVLTVTMALMALLFGWLEANR